MYLRSKFYEVVTENANATGSLPHIAHCIEYLRHAVVCAADPSLEHTRTVEVLVGDELHVTHSSYIENTTHVCNDWESLTAWTNANGADPSNPYEF